MMMASGFDKVYEIAPIFRAEEHDTLRHLNEVTSIDVETAFTDDVDAVNLLKEWLSMQLHRLKNIVRDDLGYIKI